jgi:hypothetical protein
MPANGIDSLLISARPQFPSGTFALIDWENGADGVFSRDSGGIIAKSLQNLVDLLLRIACCRLEGTDDVMEKNGSLLALGRNGSELSSFCPEVAQDLLVV